jgi:hypothetical protein
MQTIGERINSQPEMLRRMMSKGKADMRVAMPGIVVTFDSNEQTVSVLLALREKLRDKDGNVTDVAMPVLPDVPIVFPRAGGFALTMPIAPGDECLVVFSDMCIDSWWASGGIQNQLELRRHDLSDAFAIMGCWSQPNLIPNYNLSAAELRTLDGQTKIAIQPGTIDITCQTANISADSVNLAGGGAAIARVGDSITATGNDPQGGTVTVNGTITSGSSKVQAG